LKRRTRKYEGTSSGGLHEFAQTDKLSALEFRIEPDEAAEAPPPEADPGTTTPACAFDHNLASKIFEKVRKIANSE